MSRHDLKEAEPKRRLVAVLFWVFAIGAPAGMAVILASPFLPAAPPAEGQPPLLVHYVARWLLVAACVSWGLRQIIISAADMPRLKPRIRVGESIGVVLHTLLMFGIAALLIWKV